MHFYFFYKHDVLAYLILNTKERLNLFLIFFIVLVAFQESITPLTFAVKSVRK